MPAKAKRVERVVRFDRKLYGRLKAAAERNRRSTNAEIMVAIETHLDGTNGKG